MGLIDTHAHLTDPALIGQVGDVLDRARQAGVERVITVGVSAGDTEAALELARRHENQVRVCAGIHPHEAAKATDADFDRLGAMLDDPLVVGQGEMGLDYHYDFSDRASQTAVFARQLAMAGGLNLPLVIHAREAFDDAERLLLEHGFAGRRVVFHCFSGSAQEAKRIAGHGWQASFTGVVTFPKAAELQSIARDYPADRIMIETDSPYLSPVPFRGRHPNEPARLVHTARFLAELRGVGYDQLMEQTGQNASDFFGW